MKCREEAMAWLTQYVHAKLDVHWNGSPQNLVDFGIDSISLVEMTTDLELWLGAPLNSDFLATVATTDELLNAIEAQQTRDHGTREQPYKRFVNPFIGAKLEQLRMDKTFVHGKGWELTDASGCHYIDFMSQYGALPFGHHPSEIWQAVDTLKRDSEPVFAQPSFPLSSSRLAERLIELAPPGLRYVTFANSGAEAVEAALKMARHATGRCAILSTINGFHGKTFGALSATGKPDYQVHFGLPLEGFDHIAYGDTQALAQRLEAKQNFYAAFIVEPIQGEGGVTVPPAGYLREVKALCEKHGVLLIIDEVQTGLGRTGTLFACDVEHVTPDIMTLSKALGGGLVPIAAILCTERCMSEKFALKHSSTFAGNALGARVALATLDLLTRNDGELLRSVRDRGNQLREGIEALRQKYPDVIDAVRGRGLMLGIQFSSRREGRHENFLGIAAEQKELAQFIASYMLNAEKIRLAPTLNGGDVLRIQPPLNVSEEACHQVLAALDRTVALLSSAETGLFYRGIVSGQPPIELSVQGIRPMTRATAAACADHPPHRFGFLLHPLDAQSYADYDPSLKVLSDAELQEFSKSMSGLMEPVVGSTAEIISPSGARAVGDFIMISHTADQLKRMSPGDALAVLKQGLTLAKRRGASLVGLGAYTSVVSGGGLALASPDLPLTSGNTYTVASGIEALDFAMKSQGRSWRDKTGCVVGAAGAIGSCIATLLAERVGRLIMIGNPAHQSSVGREKLLATARGMVNDLIVNVNGAHVEGSIAAHARQWLAETSCDCDDIVRRLEEAGRLRLTHAIQAVGFADVVVLTVSFPGEVVAPDFFRAGALVCDISRPRALSEDVLTKRPDVLVIDGGVISLPGLPRIGPYGLTTGTSYACMAETMLLALEGHFYDTSLGRSLRVADVRWQQSLAYKHGFSIASLQCFGRPWVPPQGFPEAA